MSAQDEVMSAAAACVRAFGHHDTANYFACFAEQATFLFHSTDRLLASRAAYEQEWAGWEADGLRVISCTSADQRVDVIDSQGTVAVFTHQVTTEVTFGAASQVQQERETIVFHRAHDGLWLGVHEHLSIDPRGRDDQKSQEPTDHKGDKSGPAEPDTDHDGPGHYPTEDDPA